MNFVYRMAQKLLFDSTGMAIIYKILVKMDRKEAYTGTKKDI